MARTRLAGTGRAGSSGGRREWRDASGTATSPRSATGPHRRGRGGVRRAPLRGRRRAEGPVPVPRREDAVVHRTREPRHVPLLRLRRGRRRDHVRAEDRGPRVRRGGRAARRPGGHRAPATSEGGTARAPGAPSRPRCSRPTSGAASSTPSSCAPPRPAPARAFLTARGFDRRGAERFGCGYAPAGWDALTKHLRGRGFTVDELETGGLAAAGPPRPDRPLPPPAAVADPRPRRRGRSASGRAGSTTTTIEAKYLNTAETPALQEDARAVRDRPGQARDRQAAPGRGRRGLHRRDGLHLAGVPTAVASCGTAFGAEHIAVLRRLLIDDDSFRRRGHLHVRRRRRGPGGRAARRSRASSGSSPRPSSRSRPTAWTPASCG